MVAIIGVAPLASCETQGAYQQPAVAVPDRWSNASGSVARDVDGGVLGPDAEWWSYLKDPAISALIDAALHDNPTLAQVVAAVDEARATLRLNNAQRAPQIAVSGSAARAQVPNPRSFAGSNTVGEDAAAIGPNLSWEIDLWGRLRESAQAAKDRLSARTADAEEARLSLTAEIADTVLGLRACEYSLSVRDRDIASREIELDLMRRRLVNGNVAPVEEANASTDLDNARTDRISQEEKCTRDVDALVSLSGQDAAIVRPLVGQSLIAGVRAIPGEPGDIPPPIADVNPDALMPRPPTVQLELPASVLLGHPTVVSAEREVAARWSEIAVARADRLPKIDLEAALRGNWLHALGAGATFATWSFGGFLAGPLFDAGVGAANVSAVEARYHQAVAALRASVRAAARNVEDALAAQQSAEQRAVTSGLAVEAGRITLRAKEASWRAGSISVFELEDARRQFNAAQESSIAASRDRAQAWVDLVLASSDQLNVRTHIADGAHSFLGKQPG